MPETERACVIVGLGDSTTAGTPGFRSPIEAPPDGEGDVSSQYAYWLMRWYPAWRVLNRGVNGERSDQIAARWDRDVRTHAPAVVVLIAGVNDIYQGRRAETVQQELAAMYDRARAERVPVVAGSILPYDTATSDQNGRMTAVNDWIRAQADTRPHLVFCDTRHGVAHPGDANRLCDSPDALHPSAAGYLSMARALAPAIVRALALREA